MIGRRGCQNWHHASRSAPRRAQHPDERCFRGPVAYPLNPALRLELPLNPDVPNELVAFGKGIGVTCRLRTTGAVAAHRWDDLPIRVHLSQLYREIAIKCCGGRRS